LKKCEYNRITKQNDWRMAMKNRDKKKVSETGWMPFWWGNKFNRRLSSKRVRQHEKKELERELTEKERRNEEV
jgi:hypothetical protein